LEKLTDIKTKYKSWIKTRKMLTIHDSIMQEQTLMVCMFSEKMEAED
jgi:hypothetical protein